MIPASYSVIRCIADPARNEPVNVGIVLWTGDESHLALDQAAVDRVVRDNPGMHRDGLLGLEGILRDYVRPDHVDDIEKRLRPFGNLIVFSEPLYTSVDPDSSLTAEAALDRLLDRIVRPRRRFGSVPETLIRSLEHELRPLISSGRVVPNHVFGATSTGVPRRVDYFANSGANVGVDILQLKLKRADEIRLRADAEANKVRDIADRNAISMVVYIETSEAEDVAEATDHAKRILTAAPAELTDDVESVVDRLRSERYIGAH